MARLRGGISQHEILRVRRLLFVQQEVNLPGTPLLCRQPRALAHVGDVDVAHGEARAENRPEARLHDAGDLRQQVCVACTYAADPPVCWLHMLTALELS